METAAPVTDTSGIAEGDGHWMHDHPTIMGDPKQKNALAKYSTAEAAIVGGYDNAVLIGKPHINIPADDADDTAKAEFKAKIGEHSGAVTDPEKYEVVRPDGSDETNYNFEAEKAYLANAAKNGMTQDQMQSNLDIHNAVVSAMYTADDAANKAAEESFETEMTSELGGKANYEAFCELNTRCLESFFGKETADLIDSKKLGNHKEFAKGIQELAKMAIAEGRVMKASAQTKAKGGGALSYPKMAERQAAEK